MAPNLPPLRLLAVFDAVLRHGGIRQAAMALNVSQPAVSQSLRQLETHIGIILLDRSTRPATLTDSGRLLHRAVLDGLGQIAAAMDEIERLKTNLGESATIACSVGVATYWLMPRLAAFYDLYPGIAVNVRTTQQGAPPLAAGIDVAIRYGDGDWDDGMVRPLFTETVNPVCSPALAARLDLDSLNFEGTSLIHVDVDDQNWLTWSAYLRVMGQADWRRSNLRFTNYVQATQATLDGQGVMLGWRSITGDLVREGRLVPFANAAFVPKEAFYVVTPHRPRSASSATIVDWLTRCARGPQAAG